MQTAYVAGSAPLPLFVFICSITSLEHRDRDAWPACGVRGRRWHANHPSEERPCKKRTHGFSYMRPYYLFSFFYIPTFSICSVDPFFARLRRPSSCWSILVFSRSRARQGRGSRQRGWSPSPAPRRPLVLSVLGPSVHLGAMRRPPHHRYPSSANYVISMAVRKWIHGVSGASRLTIMLPGTV